MLKKLFLLMMLACIAAYCQVKPGENLCVNGMLEADQEPMPPFWNYANAKYISYNPNGGPNSTGCLIFENLEAEPVHVNARQHELHLVKGETYKVSMYVKTKNFKNTKHYGWVVINSGWFSEQGIKKIPENTDGWIKLEQEFMLKESKDDLHGVALFFTGLTGRVEVAQLKLEAISPEALAKSHPSDAMLTINAPRLVPISPVLYNIPAENKKIDFIFGGIKPKGNATAQFEVDGKPVASMPINRNLPLKLDNIAVGPHTLKAKIVATEGTVFERTYDICIAPTPKVDTSGHKRLNNLVTIIQEKALARANETCTISNPKEGWLYIGLQNAGNAACTVKLDGKTVITAATPRHETFRQASMGSHTLEIQGAPNAKLVVKSIANIFNYPLCANSQVPQNGKYDWAFHEKYIFPAVTTLNGGFCKEEDIPKIRKMGLLWIANLGTSHPKSVEYLLDKFQTAAGLTKDYYDGVTCDEQFFSSAGLDYYTKAIWQYKVPNDKLIYTWIVGKPGLNGPHNDFMSASINACKGKGILLFEAYCHARPTEKDAQDYLHQKLNDTMQAFTSFFPNAAAHSGMLLGNFNQIPVISLDLIPEVDYKYYLDMQLNIIANDPDFANLNTVGYWGSYYDDEELYRWSFKLLRHYAVDGNTDMLSKRPKYNYTYNPGHLVNCDFDNGLDGWIVDAASPKSITIAKMDGDFIRSSEGRWGSGTHGQNLCVLKRGENKPNTLTQVAKGLVPGRTYTLQFITVDYDDQIAHKYNPYELPLKATLSDGAKIIPEKSYVFVDNRKTERIKNAKGARVNLNHIRFVAQADTVTVTFSDEKAAPGKRYGFNYVMMKPYYDDEPIVDEK